MKSLILNWKQMSPEDLSFYRTYRPSGLINDDLADIQYRNMVDTTSFAIFNVGSLDSNFPSANLSLETASKAFRINLEDTGSLFEGALSTVLDKEESEGFDGLAIKLNKLDKDLMEQMKLGRLTITFTDVVSGLPAITVPHPDEVVVELVKRAVADTYNTSGGANQTHFAQTNKFDLKEGVIYISNQVLDQFSLRDRSLATTTKLFTQYITINFDISNSINITENFSFSNITVSNSIEVEFENGINTVYKSLDKKKSSKQGIDFIDKYNTIKTTPLSIPLLDADEFRLLDKNFFQLNERVPFFIFPLSDNDEIFNNFNFGGYMKLSSSYKPNREEFNLYSVKFKIKEVI